MKINQQSNPICLCGHRKDQHGKWCGCKQACLVVDKKDDYVCIGCLNFQMDNISYLENKYDEQKGQESIGKDNEQKGKKTKNRKRN